MKTPTTKKRDFWTIRAKSTPVYMRGLHAYDSYAVIFDKEAIPHMFNLHLN